MFQTIMRLYLKTENTDLVMKAVEKGWISREKADFILISAVR